MHASHLLLLICGLLQMLAVVTRRQWMLVLKDPVSSCPFDRLLTHTLSPVQVVTCSL
jgi:hypothetical protein